MIYAMVNVTLPRHSFAVTRFPDQNGDGDESYNGIHMLRIVIQRGTYYSRLTGTQLCKVILFFHKGIGKKAENFVANPLTRLNA